MTVRISIVTGDVTEGWHDYETIDIEATNEAYAAEYTRRIQAEYPEAEVSVTARTRESRPSETTISGTNSVEEEQEIAYTLERIADDIGRNQESWIVERHRTNP